MMHRQSGRHVNKEYYLEIECLPDEQLFSPSEIVKRKYNKRSQGEYYSKMFHAIYQFGVRNGLALKPDNGLRRTGGKQVMENGRAKLKSGERSARWYGKTWKSKLYIEDRLAIERYVQQKLVNTLTRHLEQRQLEEQAKAPVVEVVKPPKKPFSKWRYLQIAMLAAIVFTAGTVYQYNHLQDGFSVLREEGPRAAMNFFQSRGESYDNLFGTAWAAYISGDYALAESTALRVLKSPSLKDKGRAWYLLGDLKTIAGDFEAAREHLESAHAVFETLGKTKSQYRSRLALAKLCLTQKDVLNASYYANLAANMEHSRGDEYFLYIQSQIAFLNGDYQKALGFSLERETLASGDRSRLAGIYSDIGLYYGLTGNLDQCIVYTINAQSMASAQEDNSSVMYNNVNMCLYLKCSGRDNSQLKETVLTYARNNKDTRLMEHLYFVEKFECPLVQGDNGALPPPDKINSSLSIKPLDTYDSHNEFQGAEIE